MTETGGVRLAFVERLTQQFFSSLFNGLTLGAIYALIALGLSLVYGILNLINFAHGEVVMCGSFAALAVLTAMNPWPGATSVAIVAVLCFAGIVGVIGSSIAAAGLEAAAYRPLRLRGAPRHAGLISGLGASIVLQELFALLFGRNVIPYPEVLLSKVVVKIGDGVLTNKMLLIIVSGILMMVVLDSFVSRSRMGRGIRAVAQEPKAALLMGVDVSKVILATFVVGGMCAGLAGFLYSLYYSKTRYLIGFMPGIKGFTASILGGVGDLRGAMLGGLLLGLLENFGAIFLPSELRDVVAFGVLILVLLVRPTGLMGAREGKR